MRSPIFLLKACLCVALTCLLTVFHLSGQVDIIQESDQCYLPNAEVSCYFNPTSVPESSGVVAYLCNDDGPSAQSTELRSNVDCKWAKWPNGSPSDAVSRRSGGCAYLDITSSTDVLYNLGGYRSGRFRVEFDIKENPNRGARYNFQYKFSNIISQSNAFSVRLNDGGGLLYNEEFPGGGSFSYPRTNSSPYSCGTTRVVHIVDLDRDLVELFVNNRFIYCWKYSDDFRNDDNAPVALGAINFFGSASYEYQLHRIISYQQGPAYELPNFEDVVCPGNGMAFKNYHHAEYWLYSVCELEYCNTLCKIAEEIECRVPKTNQKTDNYDNLLEKYFKVNSTSDYTGYISPERIYTFTLEDKKLVRIVLSKFRRSDELDLFLLNDCNSTDVIASSRQNNATTEDIEMELEPGTYYIVVDGKSGDPANFELLVDYNCFNCFPEEDGSFIVINTEDNEEGSLRWAIECANQTPGPNDIFFDLTSDNRTIQVGSSTHDALPEIFDHGTRILNPLPESEVQESDYITIDGSFPDLDPEARGLYFNGSDDSGMEGLIIQDFPRQGVRVNSSSGFQVGSTTASKEEEDITFQNIIRFNGISEESSGLSLQNADNFLIARNEIRGNGTFGVVIQSSDVGLITQNHVSDNSMGVFLDLSSDNTISCNTIFSNNEMEVITSDFTSRSIEFRTYRKAMENSGVILFDRANNNLLVDNIIKDHTNHGIVSIEDDVFGNRFSRNLLSCNLGELSETGEAIDIVDAPNQAPPLILQAGTNGILGKAAPGDTVEVFLNEPILNNPCEDAPCQGNIYVGKATTDEAGNWSLFSEDFEEGIELRTGDFITATASQDGTTTSNYATCTRIGILETVCDLGGRFISRGIEYPSALMEGDFAPSALRNVPQVIDHFGGTYPEGLLGEIFVFRKVDQQEFEVKIFSDDPDPKGLTAFIFECDCSSPVEGEDVLCAQNYVGTKDSIYLDEDRPAGFYYIVVVDTLPRPYEIAIFPNGPCETPDVTLMCGSVESESLDIGGNDYAIGSANERDIYSAFYNGNRTLDGNDKEYAIRITETQNVSIDIFANGGISAFFYGVICGEDILDYGETSSQGGAIQFTNLKLLPGTYFLVLDQEAGGVSPDYTIEVKCNSDNDNIVDLIGVDETGCTPNQDSVHRVNFSGLNNSRINGQMVGPRDQLILEYKDADGMPRYAQVKPLYNKPLVNILAYKDGDSPDEKCGFADGEELKIRILKDFSGGTPIFKGLIGRFETQNPLYKGTKFFKSGTESLIDSVYEDPDFADKHLNVQPALLRTDGNPQRARFDVSSPVPWKATKKTPGANWYTIINGAGNGVASFEITINANSTETELTDTVFVSSDLGLVFRIPVSSGIRCVAPSIQFSENPVVLACDVTSVNITPNIQFNNAEAGWRFIWRNSAGQIISSTRTLNTNRTGTYYFQISSFDDSGCFAEGSVQVESPADIGAVANIINPVCNGTDKGSIQISVTGTTGTTDISWSNGASGTTITDLFAGDYSATIKDAAGCTKTFDFEITEPSPIIANESSTEASSGNAADGSATVSPSGGNGTNYNISWSNGNTGPNNTGLSRGIYEYTITDASNCQIIGSVEVKAQCTLATISLLKADTILACDPGTGQLIASINASFSNPIFFWKNEQGNIVSNFQSLNINQAGQYTFVVQDPEATACESTLEVEVKNAPTPQIIEDQSQDDFCADGLNGFLSIRIEDATGTPTIKWSNGEETSFISQLSKGNYTVSVSDEAGCTETATFTVGGPDPLIANAGSKAISAANQSDGQVFVGPSGGTGPYTVSWNTGAQGDTLKNLAAGTYSYTISDSNFCESKGEIEVASCSIDVEIATQASTCQDAADGVVTFSAPNGSPDFTVTWSDGGMQKNRSNLTPGDYAVTLTQGGSCSSVTSFSINIDDQEVPVIQSGQTIELFLDANGQASLNTDQFASLVTDNCTSSPALTFSTQTFDCSQLGAQSVSITARDDSNNSAQEEVTIIVRDTTPPTIVCPDNLVRNACIIDYELPTFGDNCIVNLPELVTGFLPGSTFPEGITPVTYRITDGAGNEASCSFTITSNGVIDPPIVIGEPVIIAPSIDNPSGGRIEVSFSGGVGPFSYEWVDDSGTIIGTNLVLENVLAGNYTLTITDENSGCSFTSNLFLLTDTKSIDFVDRLELYPNPSSNRFRLSITLNQALDIQYSLINHIGQTVLTSTKNSALIRDEWINVQPYPSGIYFVRIKLGEHFITRKVIIQKQ